MNKALEQLYEDYKVAGGLTVKTKESTILYNILSKRSPLVKECFKHYNHRHEYYKNGNPIEFNGGDMIIWHSRNPIEERIKVIVRNTYKRNCNTLTVTELEERLESQIEKAFDVKCLVEVGYENIIVKVKPRKLTLLQTDLERVGRTVDMKFDIHDK